MQRKMEPGYSPQEYPHSSAYFYATGVQYFTQLKADALFYTQMEVYS